MKSTEEVIIVKHCITVMSCLLFCSVAISAHAEHKLLVTDVLDAGQAEAEVDYNYSHQSYDFHRNGIGIGYNGNRTTDTSSSNYSFSLGLGYGLQVSVGIPYAFSENMKYKYNTAASRHTDFDGWGDLVCQAKYLLYGNGKKSLAIVSGLSVSLDTANDPNFTGDTTDIRAYVATSTVVANILRPYAEYSFTYRNHGNSNYHIIEAGAEYELNKTVTLKPYFDFKYYSNSEYFTDHQSYQLGLTSYVNIYKNLYLLPHAYAAIESAYDRIGGSFNFSSTKNYGGGLSLYYLFNM